MNTPEASSTLPKATTERLTKTAKPPLLSKLPAEKKYFCTAGVGYDGPTGWGTPDGIPGALLPHITKIEPDEGPVAGKTTVTITGTNFTGATAVSFGPTKAESFKVNSATSITAESPPAPGVVSGTVEVTVTTPEGESLGSPGGPVRLRL